MSDKEIVREIINAIFTVADVKQKFNGEINDRVAQIVGTMTMELKECSDTMNWVPRPPGAKATISWLALNLGKSFIRSLQNKQSYSCTKTVVWRYRRVLIMAGNGG